MQGPHDLQRLRGAFVEARSRSLDLLAIAERPFAEMTDRFAAPVAAPLAGGGPAATFFL
jgi:hypothetical protein